MPFTANEVAAEFKRAAEQQLGRVLSDIELAALAILVDAQIKSRKPAR